jgi:hypothetical protein
MGKLSGSGCLEDWELAYRGEGSEGSLIREEGASHGTLFKRKVAKKTENHLQ